MRPTKEDKRARSLIKPGAQFRLRHDPAYRVPTALTVNGTDVLHIAVSQRNKACAAAIRDALNEWSEIKASNETLHRRLVEAEEALLRIANDESLDIAAARELAAKTLFPK